MGVLDFLLPLIVTLTHLFVAPYTKVEESFSLQATHDIIHYGLPTTNVSAYLKEHYDHLAFPGSVPRSFVGPLLLAYASAPFRGLFGAVVNEQLIVRGTLALATSLALGYHTHRIRLSHGPVSARLYTLLQLSQFHIPYYASRTLPNTFALILTTFANAALLPGGSLSVGISLLTITAVIFRSEVALLLFFYAAHLLLTRRLRLPTLLLAGTIGSTLGLATSLAVDTYFWHSTPPIFTTPLLSPFLWPEASAFYFNAIQGHASAWGEQPLHYYLTSSLPKLLLNPITLLTLPTALLTTRRTAGALLLPNVWFITIYSLLVAHKEWRFIVYTIPPLTHLSALGGTWLWTRRHKSTMYLLLVLALAASLPAAFLASAAMLAISSTNYPGGAALSRLPRYLPGNNTAARVYLDVTTCMTGASWFLQSSVAGGNTIHWDKTEDPDALLTPAFWEGVDFAVTESPEKAIGTFEVVDVVKAFGGVYVLRPTQGAVGQGKEAVAEKLGLRKEERWWEDGLELRNILRGWSVRVEMREIVWILRRQREVVE